MEFQEETEQIAMNDELLMKVNNARSKLLPAKSGKRYLKEYKTFSDWRKANGIVGVDERVMLAYFEDQYNNSKPSCLWSYYAMIRRCLLMYEKIDIKRYGELHQYLKRKTAGITPKKSKVLSHNDVVKFLKEADDENYLLLKVILIFGIFGACRREELVNLTIDDVQDCGVFFKVTIPKTKTGVSRSFVITEEEDGCHYCVIIRKYMSLRPVGLSNRRLLIGSRNNKCVAQVVGVHTVGSAPRKIAEYLELPDANQFTGHCFRRSSASLLVEGGGDLGVLMNHGGWKSTTVARGYVEESTRMKTNIAKTILNSLDVSENSEASSSSSATITHSHLMKECEKKENYELFSSGNYFQNMTNCTFNLYCNKKDN